MCNADNAMWCTCGVINTRMHAHEGNLSETPNEKAAIYENGSSSEVENLLDNDNDALDDGATPDVPWKAIFTSSAVWAIIVAHTVANWGFYNLLTCVWTSHLQLLSRQ